MNNLIILKDGTNARVQIKTKLISPHEDDNGFRKIKIFIDKLSQDYSSESKMPINGLEFINYCISQQISDTKVYDNILELDWRNTLEDSYISGETHPRMMKVFNWTIRSAAGILLALSASLIIKNWDAFLVFPHLLSIAVITSLLTIVVSFFGLFKANIPNTQN